MAHFVLVHGAFGSASNWDPIVERLREAGHTVDAVDLPGAGDDPTPHAEVTLDAYARRVVAALEAAPEPSILVGHSMGGVVVTQAASDAPDRVAQLVYVAAFLPQDGESLVDLTQLPEGAGDGVQANIVVAGEPPIATMPRAAARDVLFGEVEDGAELESALDRVYPQPVLPFVTPVGLGEHAVRRRYVLCLRDRAIPPALQRRFVAERGVDRVIEIDTDHSPFVSRPAELTAALLAFAAD
ncbi:MAG TPA: alpha/beta fold hydrolase [Microbacteriaceae bacterium]|nr:alpha/beta fold hydrolase [Microbacteriaceae bacterium]